LEQRIVELSYLVRAITITTRIKTGMGIKMLIAPRMRVRRRRALAFVGSCCEAFGTHTWVVNGERFKHGVVAGAIGVLLHAHATSINAVTATADMRWVFTGGSDGFVRKFNWADSEYTGDKWLPSMFSQYVIRTPALTTLSTKGCLCARICVGFSPVDRMDSCASSTGRTQ
jgi:hypothetical protein